MPNQRVGSAAVAMVCLLIPAAGAMAQQQAYPQAAYASPYVSGYQAAQPAALVGTYKSNAFFPSPLTLTITGGDPYGNLSGSMAGWRSSYDGVPGGETGDHWETWQRVFGRDGTRAFYRDGQINVVLPNGASYVLAARGNELDGKFINGNETRSINFLKGYGVASR